MSTALYVGQVALIGGTISFLIRDKHWILRVQVLIWMLATAMIAARYGLVEQLNFYSNDQRYHTEVVQTFVQRIANPEFLITESRLPYTLPAAVLNAIGVHPTLALKTVSLLCLLILANDFRFLFQGRRLSAQLVTALLTGCGTIGIFYSVLALRETMMMLLTVRCLRTRNPIERVIHLLLIFLLRPHLAVSLLLALMFVWIIQRIRVSKTESVPSVALAIVCGSLIGYYVYSLGLSTIYGISDTFGHTWGIEPITRVASNYLGLQFVTARSETVEFSIQSLFLLRLILVETILTPTLFTFMALTRPQRLSSPHIASLLAFSIYVSLVTNTDFNSFRQNIPFMPLMGLTIIHLSSVHRSRTDLSLDVQQTDIQLRHTAQLDI